MLRHFDQLAPENFQQMERYRETNEVFILTAGQADLIICEGDEVPTAPHVLPMILNVAYNIQQAVWHNVVMSDDAHIILFERTDTTVENSDYARLDEATCEDIRGQFSQYR